MLYRHYDFGYGYRTSPTTVHVTDVSITVHSILPSLQYAYSFTPVFIGFHCQAIGLVSRCCPLYRQLSSVQRELRSFYNFRRSSTRPTSSAGLVYTSSYRRKDFISFQVPLTRCFLTTGPHYLTTCRIGVRSITQSNFIRPWGAKSTAFQAPGASPG